MSIHLKSRIESKTLCFLYLIAIIFILLVSFYSIESNNSTIDKFKNKHIKADEKQFLLLEMKKNASRIEDLLIDFSIDSSLINRIKKGKTILTHDSLINNIYALYKSKITDADELRLFNMLSNNKNNNKLATNQLMLANAKTRANLQISQQEQYRLYQISIDSLSNYINNKMDNENIQLVDDLNKKSKTIIYFISIILITFVFLGFAIYKVNKKLRSKYDSLKEQDNLLIEEKLFSSTILENVILGIIGINEQGKIILYNKRASTIFGYTEEEMIGQDSSILIPNTEKENKSNNILNYFKDQVNKEHKSVELTGINKNGNKLTLEIKLSSIVVKNNHLCIAIINDTTQKLLDERKTLRLAEINQYSQALIGISTIDHKVDYLNDSFKMVIGLDKNIDETQLSCNSIYPKHRQAIMMESVFPEVFKNGQWTGENEIQTIDGRIIPVMQTIVLHLDQEGNPEFTSSTMIDISEIKQHESSLEKTNILLKALTKLSNLSYTTFKYNEYYYNSVCHILTEIVGIKIAWITEKDIDNKLIEWGITTNNKHYFESLNNNVSFSANYIDYIYSVTKSEKELIENIQLSVDINNKLDSGNEITDNITCFLFPIFVQNKIVAVLNIYTDPSFYNENDNLLFKEIATIVSLGVEKIKSYQEHLLVEERRDLLNSIVERSNAYISITTLDHKFIYANKSGREILGYGADEDISNKFTYEVLSQKSFSVFQTNAIPIIEKTDAWSGEMELVTKSGDIITTMMVSVLHRNKQGVPLYRTNTSINISELRKKKNELNHFLEIFHNTNAYVAIANMDTSMKYLNNKFFTSMNLDSKVDVSNYKINDFHTPEAFNHINNVAIPEVLKNGKWTGQSEWINPNDHSQIIPVMQVIVLHKDKEGNPEYLSATAIDITEIKVQEKKLIKLTNDLRTLYNYQQNLKEEERKNMAKEIHDELGQNFTALKMNVDWLIKNVSIDDPISLEILNHLKSITDETIDTSRRLYNNLYPQMLEEIGLVGAIKWHANTYIKPIKIDYEIQSQINESELIKQKNTTLVLYRIYQECITNIIRYANANLVVIELKEIDDLIVMNIIDDGVGFDVDKVDITLHHGLMGIKERVFSLNGKINILSNIGQGTTTTISIPIK